MKLQVLSPEDRLIPFSTEPSNLLIFPAGSIGFGRREIRAFDLGEGEEMHLEITCGSAWVTMEADPEDHILAAGTEAVFTGPGRLVVESLEEELMLRVRREGVPDAASLPRGLH